MKPRGSALLAALLVTVAISLLGLFLMLSTTSRLTRAGTDVRREQVFLAAESGLQAARARAALAPDEVRRMALPEAVQEAGARNAPWFTLALEPGIAVEVARPVFAGLLREDGCELSPRNQAGFATEVYRVASTARDAAARHVRRVEAELVLPPAPADVLRLPEPETR